MAKVHVYVPDELYDAAMGADLNLSGTLRESLEVKLANVNGCDHETLICARCHQKVATPPAPTPAP